MVLDTTAPKVIMVCSSLARGDVVTGLLPAAGEMCGEGSSSCLWVRGGKRMMGNSRVISRCQNGTSGWRRDGSLKFYSKVEDRWAERDKSACMP